jgi:hypothetical protein
MQIPVDLLLELPLCGLCLYIPHNTDTSLFTSSPLVLDLSVTIKNPLHDNLENAD